MQSCRHYLIKSILPRNFNGAIRPSKARLNFGKLNIHVGIPVNLCDTTWIFPCPVSRHAYSSGVELAASSRLLKVNFSDVESHSYPLPWLRDNCQCPKCFHPTSKARHFLLKNLKCDGVNQDGVSIDKGTGEVLLAFCSCCCC